jgi:hypothetical protein
VVVVGGQVGGEGANFAVIAANDVGKRVGRVEHEIDTSERMLFKH